MKLAVKDKELLSSLDEKDILMLEVLSNYRKLNKTRGTRWYEFGDYLLSSAAPQSIFKDNSYTYCDNIVKKRLGTLRKKGLIKKEIKYNLTYWHLTDYALKLCLFKN